MTGDLATPPLAVVTGANKGIGFQIARQLAHTGARVLLGSRDEARGQAAVSQLAAEGLAVELLIIDVADDLSIRAAATHVRERYGFANILINNAGITSGLDSASHVTKGDFRTTFETNVFGVAAVTNEFLPLLRSSKGARIVNVSSELGSARIMSDPTGPFAALNNAAYQASKSALGMLTVLYSKELAPDGIAVDAVGPGYRSTDLNGGLPTPGGGDPADGASIAVSTALESDPAKTGRFLNHRGEVVPW